ncbi:MAG: ferredoxin [Gammaproteobacteria bacterium]|nr:ferredoxin [Gammaproteobacteria bacterium]MXW51557.1 ferredoxin [Gammaproteobacteria bacterium]MXY05183.1 ferredoxin [Gammaproteobacteria bacterium]MYE52614.1 ferredoxin [Gammaproteobacteria bacterium]MYF09979.1 ferredoxin [Gammaproteobacteria bacterium]
MKVRIDLDKCYRSGECYYNHPELFEMSDDGDPALKVTDLTDAGMHLHAEQAAEVCPAGAISIEE